MSAEEFVLQREMGCTREEFLRWLPGATRHAPMQLHGDRALIQAGDATIEIAFIQAAPRTLGRVSLPVLEVSFRFVGVTEQARREFLRYFDLYTKRGGG